MVFPYFAANQKLLETSLDVFKVEGLQLWPAGGRYSLETFDKATLRLRPSIIVESPRCRPQVHPQEQKVRGEPQSAQ